MDVYIVLLKELKLRYTFEYFNSEKIDRAILLRHDIHLQDIENAYEMIKIEKELGVKATYFVQYNIPQEYISTNSLYLPVNISGAIYLCVPTSLVY